MSEIINEKDENINFIETSIRETELVEEFLDVNDYESNSLIRMEMNVIEFPIFSKNFMLVKFKESLRFDYVKKL